MPKARPASSGASATSTATSTKRRGRGPYQLTCSNCRTRKTKCDGTQPACRICQAYGEPCQYDKLPPMSRVVAMAQRIEQLESELAELHDANPSGHQKSSNVALLTPITANASPNRHSGSSWVATGIRSPLDFYESTSAVAEPRRASDDVVTSSRISPAPSPIITFIDLEQLEYWERTAISTCAMHLRMPVQTVAHMLQTHWTWVYPTWMFVSKSIFLRDAATGGRHFSLLLLTVISLHCTRFTGKQHADELHARVRLLLGQELHREPSLVMVQTLLEMSGYEMGKGSLSQAWLYSGMAFRMAVDLNLFSPARTTTDEPVEAALKVQTAWSCYVWDKAISLYFGRVPVLSEAPDFDPPAADEALDSIPWVPYYAETKPGSDPSPMALKSYTMSAFANFCRLMTILTDVIQTIYANQIPEDALAFVQHTRERLELWRANSLEHLRIERTATHAAPPHIIIQNLLFHTITILLHRPFRESLNCRLVCRSAAESVEHLILLMDSAFGLSHVTYKMAYCAYVAATVALLDLHDNVEGSERRVNTCLRALYGSRDSCPAIQRSIDIILKELEGRIPTTTSLLPNDLSQLPNPLPAFPLENDTIPYDMSTYESVPFGGLDPFAMEWVQMPNDAFDALLSTI